MVDKSIPMLREILLLIDVCRLSFQMQDLRPTEWLWTRFAMSWGSWRAKLRHDDVKNSQNQIGKNGRTTARKLIIIIIILLLVRARQSIELPTHAEPAGWSPPVRDGDWYIQSLSSFFSHITVEIIILLHQNFYVLINHPGPKTSFLNWTW